MYSWQRLVNPETGSPYATYLDIMNVKNASDIVKGNKKPSELGVRALDSHTFEVVLTKPTPYMLNMLSFPAVFPVPQETIEKYGVNGLSLEIWLAMVHTSFPNGWLILKLSLNA